MRMLLLRMHVQSISEIEPTYVRHKILTIPYTQYEISISRIIYDDDPYEESLVYLFIYLLGRSEKRRILNKTETGRRNLNLKKKEYVVLFCSEVFDDGFALPYEGHWISYVCT